MKYVDPYVTNDTFAYPLKKMTFKEFYSQHLTFFDCQYLSVVKNKQKGKTPKRKCMMILHYTLTHIMCLYFRE